MLNAAEDGQEVAQDAQDAAEKTGRGRRYGTLNAAEDAQDAVNTADCSRGRWTRHCKLQRMLDVAKDNAH